MHQVHWCIKCISIYIRYIGASGASCKYNGAPGVSVHQRIICIGASGIFIGASGVYIGASGASGALVHQCIRHIHWCIRCSSALVRLGTRLMFYIHYALLMQFLCKFVAVSMTKDVKYIYNKK